MKHIVLLVAAAVLAWQCFVSGQTTASAPTASGPAAKFLTVPNDTDPLPPFYMNSKTPTKLGDKAVGQPNALVRSPGPGMTFTAGIPIRVFGDANDPSAYKVNFEGSPKVECLLDGKSQGTVDSKKDLRSFFEFFLKDVPAGKHVITVKGHYFDGTESEGTPVPIVVEPPAKHAGQVKLSEDMVLKGDADLKWDDVTVVGGGFRVRCENGWTGSVTIRNSHVSGLGSVSAAGIDLKTAAGSVTIQDSVFEADGELRFAAGGKGDLIVQNSDFRANNLIQFISSNPDKSPMIVLTGNPSGKKLFQGNRVGTGWAQFEGGTGWLIGGDTDAQGNIFIGPRSGVFLLNCRDGVIRGNYSHHDYSGGWSQGFNFKFAGSQGILCEHNVIRGSSWPLQSFGGEFRYNLMVDSGHNWVRTLMPGAKLHHNVWVQVTGQGSYDPNAGIFSYGKEKEDDLRIYNNTFNGGGAIMAWPGVGIDIQPPGSIASLRNNLFYDFVGGNAAVKPIVQFAPGCLLAADYNAFFNNSGLKYEHYVQPKPPGTAPAASAPSLDFGKHDVSADPKLAVGVELPYPVKEGHVWNRQLKVSAVLAYYRACHEPLPGSPLLGAGDPADGLDSFIGAIGNGKRPDDLFGKFGKASGPTVGGK